MNACRRCSCVFITIGPYHATGSSSGRPETRRNRIPSSPACTMTSSPVKAASTWNDLGQNHRPARARDRRQVSCESLQGAVSEHREGDGLLGIHSQAVVVRKLHRQVRQQLLQAREQQTIVSSTAGNDQPVDLYSGKNKPLQRIANRAYRQFGCRAQQIFLIGQRPAKKMACDEILAKLLPPGALGWPAAKERQPERLHHEWLNHPPLGCQAPS